MQTLRKRNILVNVSSSERSYQFPMIHNARYIVVLVADVKDHSEITIIPSEECSLAPKGVPHYAVLNVFVYDIAN